jgi:hypothetical protein
LQPTDGERRGKSVTQPKCNGGCGRTVPLRTYLAGHTTCAECRAQREHLGIFWRNKKKPPAPVYQLRPSPQRPTGRPADPDDPNDERNRRGAVEPGIFQFNEHSVHDGRAHHSGTSKDPYYEHAKDWKRGPRIITVAQWTKGMRKPSKTRYEAAMAKQHEAQALAIRRELFAPILADILARGGSANQMEAFRLRAVEDLTQAQTARKMGCSEKNVEKLVIRSKRWLGVQNLSRFRPV